MLKKSKSSIKLVVIAVCCSVLFSCTWLSNRTTIDFINITTAVANFSAVVDAVEANTDKFSPEELAILVRAKSDFLEVSDVVTSKGSLITIGQLKVLRGSIKDLYVVVHAIVQTRLPSFSISDRFLLLDFHSKMVSIDQMITELEEDPDNTAKHRDTIDALLTLLSIASKVFPMAIA